MEKWELESTNAYRIYHGANRSRGTETEEQRDERLVTAHNLIFDMTGKISNVHDYIRCRNLINAYADERGKEHYTVKRLKKNCYNRLVELIDDTNNEIEKIKTDIDALQAIRIEDTPEEAEQLEKASQFKLYEYLTQLNPKGNIEGNKRRIGNWCCKNPDRVEALALTKLSIMNEYCDCFTPRYRETLSERIRKPEQVEHEEMIAPTLREMNAKMGKLFMKNFQLRQASKQLSN